MAVATRATIVEAVAPNEEGRSHPEIRGGGGGGDDVDAAADAANERARHNDDELGGGGRGRSRR